MSTPANALDTQTLADYRAIREGRVQTKTETTPAPEKAADEKTPAAVEPAELTEGTEPEDKEESKPEVDKEQRKRERLDKRFSELTRERDEALRQLTEERSRPGSGPQKDASQAGEKSPAVIADPNDPEPDAAKFTDYLEWQKAWNRWDRRQDQRAQAAAEQKRKAADDAKSRASAWEEKVIAARVKHDDYDEVALANNLPITQTMAQAITDTDLGTELLYHLGQNPLEAARIAKLSPVAQVREIGKLEAKLAPASTSDEKSPSETKPVSQAPKPVKALAGAAAASASGARNLEGMTQKQYREYRESGKL
jgi:hypothetical protein